MVLVSLGFDPVQPWLPVNVSVAVKLPLVPVGVKVARAGLIFCTHVPTPPLHVAALKDPVAVAPVIAIGASGVPSQRVIVAPAVGTGVWPQVIVLELVGLLPEQPSVPVKVNTAEKLPLVPVGVKVARAGSIF